MPESFEKRQRDRRKQLKRKEKRERKAQRKAAKTRGPEFHALYRDGDRHRFETELWLGMLDIVTVGGWTPPETGPNEEPASAAFARPAGLSLDDDVALDLAERILGLLDTISEEELPFSGHDFGERHTENVLARRIAGEPLGVEDSAGAYELLSGPPKQALASLAEYLQDGAASIEAD